MNSASNTSPACFIYVFKEGLLSAAGHDLKLEVRSIAVTVKEQTEIQVKFNARSIKVISAMKNGSEAPEALSEKDKIDIEKNMAKEVLDLKKFSEIEFKSTSIKPTGPGFSVTGSLTLNGVSREITFATRPVGSQQTSKITLNQNDFGIKPFSALFGTLRINPEIVIEITV